MYIRVGLFLFVLFLVVFPATVRAQSVVVLGITSMEGDDELARGLTTALRNALVEQGCSVDSRDVALTQMQFLQSTGSTLCNQVDVDCLDGIALALTTGSLVFGLMHRVFTDSGLVQEIEVELHYYDRLERRLISHYRTRMSLTASPEAIDIIAGAAAPELIHCVRPIVPPPLPVDEDESDVDLTAHPVAPPEEIVVPAAPASHNHEWVGGLLIGLGAALVIADIPVWARLNDLNSDPSMVDYRHRLAFGATGDACTNASAGNTLSVPGLDPTMASMQVDRVRSICSEGATLEIVQYVLPILGALVGATGATLLATGVLVSPSASADHATLTVSGSF